MAKGTDGVQGTLPPLNFFYLPPLNISIPILKGGWAKSTKGVGGTLPPPKFILFATTKYFNYNSESWLGKGLYGCSAGGILPPPPYFFYLPPLKAFIPILKVGWARGTWGAGGTPLPPPLFFSICHHSIFWFLFWKLVGQGALGGQGAFSPPP